MQPSTESTCRKCGVPVELKTLMVFGAEMTVGEVCQPCVDKIERERHDRETVKRLERMNIPRRAWGLSWSSLEQQAAGVDTLTWVQDIRNRKKIGVSLQNRAAVIHLFKWCPPVDTNGTPLKWERPAQGIFLQGGVGSGKTFLAYMIALSCARARVGCKFLDEATLFRNSREPSYQDGILQTQVLILDDLGVEGAEWQRAKTADLIDSVYRQGPEEILLIVTSNLSIERIQEVYGQRTASRLTEMTRSLTLTGIDWRLGGVV